MPEVTKLHYTPENTFSTNYLLGKETTQWLDSDGEVTVVNCRQRSDYKAIGSSVNDNGDYTVTGQSLC